MITTSPAPKHTFRINWKKTTVGEARKLERVGYMIWWRPDGVLTKDNPNSDIAMYAEG